MIISIPDRRGGRPFPGLLHCAIALLAVLTICTPENARAHPHGWIDLRSTVILNESGKIAAIEQEWLFDEFYSVFATDGWDLDSAAGKAALNELARGNIENLRDYDYFTEILADGEKQAIGDVEDYETGMRGGRLWLRLTVPLDAPVDPVQHAVSYSVFDPTYYIEVLHLQGDIVSFRDVGELSCTGEIVQPAPTMEAVTMAQALPPDAEVDDTLGRLFAERVEISCK